VEAALQYFSRVLEGMSGRLEKVYADLEDAVGVKSFLNEIVELAGRLEAKVAAMKKADALIDAVNEGKELDPQPPDQNKAVRFATPKTNRRSAKSKKEKGAEKVKKERIDTRLQSYQMFREGLSVKQIAKERGLKSSTIESHLAEYIRKGELELEQLVDAGKAEKIIKVVISERSPGLKTIKERLGRKASYGEIKMVMAAMGREK